jgi:hypothetical protein
MTFSREQQRLNYDVFERLYIAHAADLYISSRYHQTGFRPLEFAVASMLEGLGWLWIGSSVGYFADNVFRAELDSIRRRHIPDILEEYTKEWEYLFDPFWLIVFDDFANAATLKSAPEFSEEASLETIFQSLLLRAVRSSRHPCTEAAEVILNFYRAKHVTEIIRIPSSSVEVAEALEQEVGLGKNFGAIPVGVIYAGFGTMVQYLDDFRSAFQSGMTNPPERAKIIAQLYRRIAQLQAWRFHFIAGTSLEDLQHMFISKYLDVMDINEPEFRQEFIQYLKDLGIFMRSLQTPRVASASGPA